MGPVRGGALLGVLAATMLLGGSIADAGERPHGAIAGVWETEIWRRRSGEKLLDIPEQLDAERWRITRPRRCRRQTCVLRVVTEALVGPPFPLEFELRPDGKGRYVGELDFVSMCVDPTTGAVRERHASDVTSTYRARVDGSGDDRELALTSGWSALHLGSGVVLVVVANPVLPVSV